MTTTTFDYLIVGKGLIGSAAAKYLALAGANVAIIGPDEPVGDYAKAIVFASHFDQGRITLKIGKQSLWTQLNALAIAQYGTLERQSGITFHSPVGCLYVSPAANDEYIQNARQVAPTQGIPLHAYSNNQEVAAEHPEFFFPPPIRATFEGSPAGHINPRAHKEAQLLILKKQGGQVINDVVIGLKRQRRDYLAETLTGSQILAKKVLVAAGAFTNFNNLLPRKIKMTAESETTILARVSREEAMRLARLPSLLYKIATPQLNNIYLIRPLLFPDGHYYLKMGCNLSDDLQFHTLSEAQKWFVSGNSAAQKTVLEGALRTIMPHLNILDMITKRCIITRTPTGYPYIGNVDDQGLFVAAGGNGYAAKCSDALGHLATNLMLYGHSKAGIPLEAFIPQFSDTHR